MPIVVRNEKGGMRLVRDYELAQLSLMELALYKDHIKACLTRLPDSPVLHNQLEAVEREVRWRNEDSCVGWPDPC